MKLSLNNIGMIKKADIKLNGITVIAGKNGTGKSTIGKTLFTIFNSFSHYEDEIKNARIKQFTQEIEKKAAQLNIAEDFYKWSVIAESMFSNPNYYHDDEKLKELIKNSFDDSWLGTVYDKNGEPISSSKQIDVDNEFLQVIKNTFKVYSGISDTVIYSNLFNRRITSEFKSQINNEYTDGTGSIELTIKDKTVIVEVNNNLVSSIKDYFSLNTEALYLDDPFILDDLPVFYYRSRIYNRVATHQSHLRAKLLNENNGSEIEEVVREEAITSHINKIINKIDEACNGELANTSGGIIYKSESSNKAFKMANVSTGLKTFIIIKRLLLNGSLEDNGTLILDEPEIHLHPEWQVLFAEIIVLLQKEFNMHILLNTHSPYFIEAIEVFVDKHGVKDKSCFYLAEKVDNEAIVNDVTDETEKIYKQLAEPFQVLENLRWEND